MHYSNAQQIGYNQQIGNTQQPAPQFMRPINQDLVQYVDYLQHALMRALQARGAISQVRAEVANIILNVHGKFAEMFKFAMLIMDYRISQNPNTRNIDGIINSNIDEFVDLHTAYIILETPHLINTMMPAQRDSCNNNAGMYSTIIKKAFEFYNSMTNNGQRYNSSQSQYFEQNNVQRSADGYNISQRQPAFPPINNTQKKVDRRFRQQQEEGISDDQPCNVYVPNYLSSSEKYQQAYPGYQNNGYTGQQHNDDYQRQKMWTDPTRNSGQRGYIDANPTSPRGKVYYEPPVWWEKGKHWDGWAADAYKYHEMEDPRKAKDPDPVINPTLVENKNTDQLNTKSAPSDLMIGTPAVVKKYEAKEQTTSFIDSFKSLEDAVLEDNLPWEDNISILPSDLMDVPIKSDKNISAQSGVTVTEDVDKNTEVENIKVPRDLAEDIANGIVKIVKRTSRVWTRSDLQPYHPAWNKNQDVEYLDVKYKDTDVIYANVIEAEEGKEQNMKYSEHVIGRPLPKKQVKTEKGIELKPISNIEADDIHRKVTINQSKVSLEYSVESAINAVMSKSVKSIDELKDDATLGELYIINRLINVNGAENSQEIVDAVKQVCNSTSFSEIKPHLDKLLSLTDHSTLHIYTLINDKLTNELNKSMSLNLSLNIKVTSFHDDCDSIVEGLKEHFGSVISNGLKNNENKIIQSAIMLNNFISQEVFDDAYALNSNDVAESDECTSLETMFDDKDRKEYNDKMTKKKEEFLKNVLVVVKPCIVLKTPLTSEAIGICSNDENTGSIITEFNCQYLHRVITNALKEVEEKWSTIPFNAVYVVTQDNIVYEASKAWLAEGDYVISQYTH